MRLSIIINPIDVYGPQGWSPKSNRLGGSEEWVVEVAKRLARSHEVHVYHNGQHGVFEGVQYEGYDKYKHGDLTINVNYPEFPVHGTTIFWSSLTNHPDLDQFDAVCAISQYAKDHTGLPERAVIIPCGYDATHIYPQTKVPKQCFYASSPDRGLDVLMEAWPKVYEAYPDATLIVTYGGQLDLPGVINLGECDEATMNELYQTSDIWAYPCTGNELFCMVGKKAQVAGCIPVIIPHMALAETVQRGFKTDKEHYAQSLIEVLGMNMEYRDLIRKDIAKHANALTWDEVTDQLQDLITSLVQ